MLVAVFARVFVKLTFVDVSVLFAGSMTHPPALASASSLCRCGAPAAGCAMVYPLATLLRILAAQVLAITLCS
jgi:putative transport protein